MDPMPGGVRRACVFSHPNHELAVHGFVLRNQAALVFLTDGGGADRVADTRDGLARLGHTGPVTFLDRTEQALYEALLCCDHGFYADLSTELAAALVAAQPDEVFCDAIEYYNPVHDMAVPVTRRALAALPGVPLFEIPLIHQLPGERERYRVQRVPPSRRAGASFLALTPHETAAKRAARAMGYGILLSQLGPVCDQDAGLYAREEFMPAHVTAPSAPPADVALRYAWRGARLLERGDVREVITHDAHWLPLAQALMDGVAG
jgi:hypothetical protein